MNGVPNFSDLVDIRTVAVEANLPKQERIVEFVRQIKTPFHYKCGKYRVRARFLAKGPSLEDSLTGMML